jgi:hypothetical protein
MDNVVVGAVMVPRAPTNETDQLQCRVLGADKT